YAQNFQHQIAQIFVKYPNIKTKSESYLELRNKYKNDTFSNNKNFSNNKLKDVNDKFYGVIKELEDEEIPKFIVICSYQDIIVFYNSLINDVQNDKFFNFKGLTEYQFISDQKQKFEKLFQSVSLNLLDNVSNYIENVRNKYKSDLYLLSRCELDKFKEVTEKHKDILDKLDNETEESFKEVSKYQDYIYICQIHMAQLNNE
ncbi:6881_t:CDS:1, partial [Cetraspora pellucida]